MGIAKIALKLNANVYLKVEDKVKKNGERRNGKEYYVLEILEILEEEDVK